MNIDYQQCLYINAESKNAEAMLDPCNNGVDDFRWACERKQFMDNAIISRNLERPSGDNTDKQLYHSLMESSSQENRNSKDPKKYKLTKDVKEGFTNLGESYVPQGECPDGYYWCNKSHKCVQICQNCKFNEKKYLKSKEFNEYDPCFPNRGVYNGINNKGIVQCTCGKNNEYCDNGIKQGNIFDTQGGMMYKDTYIVNVGDYFNAGDLAAY